MYVKAAVKSNNKTKV